MSVHTVEVRKRATVVDSFDRVMARSIALQVDAERIRRSSDIIRQDARRVVTTVRASRRRLSEAPPRSDLGFGFRLRGFIEAKAVAAEWTPDGLVDASQELLDRADLVVRLGETFTFADGSRRTATLDAGPTRALLTLMRACDRVESVSLELAD